MRKCLSIVFYEYKMQMRRFATWGVLIVATIVALLDSFPSAGNFARLGNGVYLFSNRIFPCYPKCNV